MTRKSPKIVLFNLYAWPVGGVFTVLAAVVIALLPGQRRRRLAARASARALLWLLGCRLSCDGLEKIPPEACMVASNHASYLDGIILTAALPPNFGFAIKHEVTKVPIMHLLLRRLGSEFIDRSDQNASRGAATRLLRLARGGKSLGMFPEGTFRREPGLLPFRKGAFLTAVRTGMPTVAVVIEGSRNVLPADSWLIAPSPIHVEVIASIPAPENRRGGSEVLCRQIREAMLSKLAEPDIAEPE